MNVVDIITHIYLPLLTQETGVMVSTFTYGLKTGVSSPVLVLANTAAVATDIALFFLPTYFLSGSLHSLLAKRFETRYEQGQRFVKRIGVFPAATAMAFVMPSVVAMIVVGLLHLEFRRALAGLFLGSALYVALPLAIAAPLSRALPAVVVPFLQWVAPALAVAIIVVALVRASLAHRRQQHA